MMKMVDSQYDKDVQSLMDKNKEMQEEVESLECALKVAERQGSHMDAMARFFTK